MVNNITNVDTRLQQMGVAKSGQSLVSLPMPPIIGFKTPKPLEKAELRYKKFKRADNIIIAGEIDDDYVDIIEEVEEYTAQSPTYGFVHKIPIKKKTKYLKDCYVLDYIQAVRQRQGQGTLALKGFVEKAFFDTRAQGRIVTFSSPVWKESSPAQFFYKMGFRFLDPEANSYIEECIVKKMPDSPPQTGMMYLPRKNIHRLLRYGDMF
ncbi:MAG: hypothetical protein E7Z92_00455 [Cyanobacteria bacterium SIG31]|nr:hypothetical protein [Cyanobacteria bacterium SIG31]